MLGGDGNDFELTVAILGALTFWSSFVSVMVVYSILLLGNLQPNAATEFAALISICCGTLGGCAYFFLYRQEIGIFWPIAFGSLVLTLATFAACEIVRLDGQWPRLRLRTLLGLTGVAGIVFGTIAPAFSS